MNNGKYNNGNQYNKNKGGYNNNKFQPDNQKKIPGTSVQVRNDDVNGALRRLKKMLEGADRQKELSKREYYEKPSMTRKRNRDQAIKRHQREMMKELMTGASPQSRVEGVSYMKSKRKRRKIQDIEAAISAAQRKKR